MKKPKILIGSNGFQCRAHNKRSVIMEDPLNKDRFILEFNTFYGKKVKTAHTSYKRGVNTTTIRLSTESIEMIVQGYMEYLKSKGQKFTK